MASEPVWIPVHHSRNKHSSDNKVFEINMDWITEPLNRELIRPGQRIRYQWGKRSFTGIIREYSAGLKKQKVVRLGERPLKKARKTPVVEGGIVLEGSGAACNSSNFQAADNAPRPVHYTRKGRTTISKQVWDDLKPEILKYLQNNTLWHPVMGKLDEIIDLLKSLGAKSSEVPTAIAPLLCSICKDSMVSNPQSCQIPVQIKYVVKLLNWLQICLQV